MQEYIRPIQEKVQEIIIYTSCISTEGYFSPHLTQNPTNKIINISMTLPPNSEPNTSLLTTLEIGYRECISNY